MTEEEVIREYASVFNLDFGGPENEIDFHKIFESARERGDVPAGISEETSRANVQNDKLQFVSGA